MTVSGGLGQCLSQRIRNGDLQKLHQEDKVHCHRRAGRVHLDSVEGQISGLTDHRHRPSTTRSLPSPVSRRKFIAATFPPRNRRGHRTYFVACDAQGCLRRVFVSEVFAGSSTDRHHRSPRCGLFRSSRSPILGVDSSTPRTIASAVTRSNGSCQRCIARSNVPL